MEKGMRVGLMKRIIGMLLIFSILINVFVVFAAETDIKADVYDVPAPQFSLESINKGTGVKICIEPTSGVDGYGIYLSKTNNAYSDYMFNNGNGTWHGTLIGTVEEDGTQKRYYNIEGMTKGEYTFRVLAFRKVGNEYVASGSWAKSIKIKAAKKKSVKEKSYDFSKAKVGDTIVFGSYEQDGNMRNGKEPIEWIVLEKTSKQLLVLSKKVLDCLPYNKVCEATSWEKCSLRKWLNNSFYKNAFTKKERAMIKTTKLSNDANFEYGTSAGKNTKDKVFLLSIDEISRPSYGFGNIYATDAIRSALVTPYSKTRGIQYIESELTEGEDCCWSYWLRSPGENTSSAAIVDSMGMIWADGNPVSLADEWDDSGYDTNGIRPAMYIKIK